MEIRQLVSLRHLFSFKKHVYLDHNATTNVSSYVRRTMNRVLKKYYGNPSSLYDIGRKSAEILEEARLNVANAIHADTQEVYFTGCATESNNAIIKSLSDYFYPERSKIISTPIEHPSVINTMEYLSTRGIIVQYCPVDKYGFVDLSELEKMIDKDTFLVCSMLANNETGAIQDIASVVKIASRYDVLVMSDCVQAFGKIPIDVHELGINYASFSAHKLYGPKGIGALYVKQGSPFAPFIHGGHQENGMRAGTEGLHNIAGFGAACQKINKILACAEHNRKLKDQLIRNIVKFKNDSKINSPETNCLPNTLSVSFPNIDNSQLLAMLDYWGISVSAGSACSSQESKPSHVLKAIGLSDDETKETIRISLGCNNTAGDIRYATRVFQNFFNDRHRLVNIITATQLNEISIFDEQMYILDVRPQFLRRKLKSLPNAHEVSFFSIEKFLNKLPSDKHIIVVCQHGNLSYVTAYYLKSKGFRQVSSLQGGTVGWKALHCDLYQKYAGYKVQAV